MLSEFNATLCVYVFTSLFKKFLEYCAGLQHIITIFFKKYFCGEFLYLVFKLAIKEAKHKDNYIYRQKHLF